MGEGDEDGLLGEADAELAFERADEVARFVAAAGDEKGRDLVHFFLLRLFYMKKVRKASSKE